MTSLFCASKHGHSDTVRALLQRAEIDVNAQSNRGTSALLFACRNSHADAVRVLLEHAGVDVNLLNNAGESALSRASTAAIRDLLTARGAR
jgi:ankyrin repeat protein